MRQDNPFMDSPIADVLCDIWDERLAQDEKWGEQNHAYGTGGWGARMDADVARERCNHAFAREEGTWAHILDEEFREALAENDDAKLRAELIQVAAVAVAWVQAIDRRGA